MKESSSLPKTLKLYDYAVGFYLEQSALRMTCDEEIFAEIRDTIKRDIKGESVKDRRDTKD